MFKPRKLYLVFMLTSMASIVAAGQSLSKTIPVRFLALGDSYTIGESVAEVQRWPVQLIHALKKQGYTCSDPDIVAVTGWRTDDLKKGLNSGRLSSDYNLVSLLIGVNNQYQGKSVSEYEREFDGLLKMAIGHAGGDASKVFVLSIPDYGFTPFGKNRQVEISTGIDAFNAVNETIAEKNGVTYIHITDISRLGLKYPDLVAADGLHPSGKMYGLWVERILEVLF